MNFCETFHCRRGTHCKICRDRSGGRPWRAERAATFEVPPAPSRALAVDWDCPRGRPWGFVPPARGLGDLVARALEALRVARPAKALIRAVTRKPCGCAKRRAALNRLVPFQ